MDALPTCLWKGLSWEDQPIGLPMNAVFDCSQFQQPLQKEPFWPTEKMHQGHWMYLQWHSTVQFYQFLLDCEWSWVIEVDKHWRELCEGENRQYHVPFSVSHSVTRMHQCQEGVEEGTHQVVQGKSVHVSVQLLVVNAKNRTSVITRQDFDIIGICNGFKMLLPGIKHIHIEWSCCQCRMLVRNWMIPILQKSTMFLNINSQISMDKFSNRKQLIDCHPDIVFCKQTENIDRHRWVFVLCNIVVFNNIVLR